MDIGAVPDSNQRPDDPIGTVRRFMASSSSLDAPSSPGFRFRLGRLVRLARKELTEVLRDRRTIFTLVLMPLLLYPLLAASFYFFLQSAQLEERTPTWRVGFRTVKEQNDVLAWIANARRDAQGQRRDWSMPEVPEPHFLPDLVEEPVEAVRQGLVDVALVPGPPIPAARGELAIDLEMIYREDNPYAREAVAHLHTLCMAHNAGIMSVRLRRLGWQQRPDPFRLVHNPIKTEAKSGFSLAVFVPLVLILMTITGAVYPAIDLTAGERERGTLEVLIAAPIPRRSVLFGKYVAVLCVAVLTALVNLTAMTISIQVSGQADRLFGTAGLSLLTLLEVFGLVLLFAVFFSAVLLVVTSFARSFKEAQAYLVPLMLLSLAPGVLGLFPGLNLAGPLAIVPLLNIVLLSRDLLTGGAQPLWAAVVVVSTAAYAALALFLAARLFGTEAVLYTETGNWGRPFRRRRA